MAAIESMWWKVGVNYDDRPLERMKQDLRDVDALVHKLNAPASSNNSALSERLSLYRDLEKQVRKTAISMVIPVPQGSGQASQQTRQQIEAVNALAQSYRVTGREIEQVTQRLRHGGAAAVQSRSALSQMFRGIHTGADGAIGRLDLMRANLEKLGRLTAGAGIAGGIAGTIISGAQNVVQTEGSAYATGTSARAQMRFGSQLQALGGRREDAAPFFGNINKLVTDAQYGQISDDTRLQMTRAGINIDQLRQYFDPRGNDVTGAADWLRGRIHDEGQRNPGSVRTAAMSLGLSESSVRPFMTKSAQDWQREGALFDRSGAAPDEEVTKASERWQSATTHFADNMTGILNQLIKLSDPLVKGLEKANEHPILEAAAITGGGAWLGAKMWSGIKNVFSGGSAGSAGANTAATEATSASRLTGAKLASEAGARAAGTEVAVLSRLAPVLRFANVATTAAWAMQPIKTAGPEIDTLSGAGLIETPPPRRRDRFDELNAFKQDDLKNKIQARDSGRIPTTWEGNDQLRAYDEGIWNEHQKNLEEYRQQAAIYQQQPSTVQDNMDVLQDLRHHIYSPDTAEEARQRILFKESRGNRYEADGKLKVNKKSGARGEYQVMPATAHQPGYNIDPARDDSPEEYARVGQELIKAYNQKYHGDIQKIMSAYNAGPGATDRAINRYGDQWRSHMSPETRGYIDYDPTAPNYGNYRQMAGGQGPTVTVHVDARGNQQPHHLERAVENGVRRGIGQANTVVTTLFRASASPDA